jgi:hypothetical protein
MDKRSLSPLSDSPSDHQFIPSASNIFFKYPSFTRHKNVRQQRVDNSRRGYRTKHLRVPGDESENYFFGKYQIEAPDLTNRKALFVIETDFYKLQAEGARHFRQFNWCLPLSDA